MNPMTKDLWVFVETEPNGAARNVGIELLTPGREIARKQGGRLVAVVIGSGVDPAVEEAAVHGADQVIVLDAPEYQNFTTDAYTSALVRLVEKYGPTSLLIGATPNGRDFAPRVSCRLKTGLTADCTGLDVDEETGNVLWTRPTFGGNLMAQIQCPDHRPQMGTVRPGVFKKCTPTENRAEIVREDIRIPAEEIRTRVLEVIQEISSGKVDLEGAEIIVAGGRGVGGPAGFVLIRELAEALGGEVGASRPAVDAGWIPHAHQIGQTGKTIGPKLYIACGISGAIQHTAGIAGSETVVAINSDPEAPIFQAADYGIVGDLFEVLPVLIREIKAKKDADVSRPAEQVRPRPPVWAENQSKACHIDLAPPKHASQTFAKDLAAFRKRYDAYTGDGFIISITDNAMAKMAFQGTEIIEALELVPRRDNVLIHLNTFHRKEELDRILADVQKLGLRNILAITGDGSDKMHKLLPEELEAPEAPVTTSVELIRYIRRHYPDFIIGAAFNNYEPPESEFAKLDKKLAAGASYVITQPVLGKDEQVDRLLRDYPGLPVVTEVWMSRKLSLLSDILEREIPDDYPYDPFETLRTVRELYPSCGTYLAMLSYKNQYPALRELWK